MTNEEETLFDKRCVNNLVDKERFWREKDVKEFIKRLKEKFCYCTRIYSCVNCATIDKLAGDEFK